MKRMILAIVMAFTLTSCGTGYYSSTIVTSAAAYDYPTHVPGAINISIQPSWGPAGYNYAMYYYFPEFNFYYDVERALFYYLSSGRWISAKVLPKGRHYPTDLHRYYKVVINERNPWNYNRQHKTKYKQYKGVYTQRNLRDVRHEKETPRRIQTPQHSTPPRNNNTMQGPQSTPNRGQGGVGQGQSNSRPPQQGNVGSQGGNTRPSGSGSSQGGNVKPGNGNNSSVRPGSGSSSQGNVRPGGSSSTTRPSGSGSSQGNVRPGSGSNVKPSGTSTPSRGTAKPSGSSSSKGSGSKSSVKSGSSSKSSSSGSRSAGSQSSGSRSTGSRGR